jgi:hypothetical protein
MTMIAMVRRIRAVIMLQRAVCHKIRLLAQALKVYRFTLLMRWRAQIAAAARGHCAFLNGVDFICKFAIVGI